MKICLFGLTACGKTYQSKELASYFNIEFVSGSKILLAKLDYKDNAEEHYWLKDAGTNLNSNRDSSNVDNETDLELMKKLNASESFITDSWTMPWLLRADDIIKIKLNPNIQARARMAMESKTEKSFTLKVLEEKLCEKDESSKSRFQSLHGFNCFDESVF